MKQLKKIKIGLLMSFMIPIFSFGQVRPNIMDSQFTSQDRTDLANLIMDFVTPEILRYHCDYSSSPWNVTNIHSDFDFLPFHRTYIEKLEDYLMEQGRPDFVPLPAWNPSDNTPAEFQVFDPDCGSVSCANAPSGNDGCDENINWNINYIIPPYLQNLCQYNFSPTVPGDIDANGLSVKLETPYHNNVHWSMANQDNANVMGNFRSPAMPIFWLWHAFLDDMWKDWECNCPQSTTLQVDLYMKDTPKVVTSDRDRGEEPNIDDGPMSLSEDIWVRKQQDGFSNHGHQNAEFYTTAGLSNYIYVQVRNRGCVNSVPNANTKLKLYWVKSTTGVIWPDSWIGNITTGGGLPLGGLIGSVTIPVVEAGGSTILEFAWNPVDPSNYPQVSFYEPKDFCLLARIESDYDTMTFTETPEFWVNVNNNNNIIWKNIVVLDADPNNIAPGGGTSSATGNYYGSVYISNPKPNAEVYSLSFLAENAEIVDYADITVTMTQELWDIWQTGGGQIDGEIKDISRDPEFKKIQILTPNATLYNLSMPSGGLYPIAIEFNFHADDFSNLLPEYKYQIQQRYNGSNHIFGTETYIVKTGNRNPIIANAGIDQVISEGDNANLSANDVGSAVIYNWYAPDGSLIYTGKDLTVNPDISKKYKLEVISTLDGVKDYDEVEVRVKEFEILNMSPNPSSNLVNISYKAINANSAYLMITMAYGSSSNYILDVDQNNTTIDISNYQTGTYNIVLVCNGQAVDVSTLVVQ